MEHAGERGAGRALGGRAAEGLAHLRVDLRLSEHHRIEARGDLEQVVGRVAFPVGETGGRSSSSTATPRVSLSTRFNPRNPAW